MISLVTFRECRWFPISLLIVLLSLISSLTLQSGAFSLAGTPIHSDVRESTSRPFWLDKASFLHDGFLFGVGIASRADNLVIGRQRAFEAGKRELQNYLPSTNIDRLTIETKDMYEEQNEDGSYTVYRLVMLPLVGQPEAASMEFERQARKLEVENRRKIESARQGLLKEQAEAEAHYYEQLASLFKESQEREKREKEWKQLEQQAWLKRFEIETEIHWQAIDRIKAEIQVLALELPNSDMSREAFQQHMRASRQAKFEVEFALRAKQWRERRGPAFIAKLNREAKQYQKEQEYMEEQFARCIGVGSEMSTDTAVSQLHCAENAEQNYEYVKKIGVKEAVAVDRRFRALFEDQESTK